MHLLKYYIKKIQKNILFVMTIQQNFLNLGKTIYGNKADINWEINNYKKFKEVIINYLNKNKID